MTCRYPCCRRPSQVRGLCKTHHAACLRNGNLERHALPSKRRRGGRSEERELDPFANLTPPPEKPEYVAEILDRIAMARSEKLNTRIK